MLSRIRCLPSPPLAVSMIALIVVLGGSAYAAITLPKDSVGTKQLKRRAVSAAKLKQSAVTSRSLAQGAVTSAKLGNGAVGASALNGVVVREGTTTVSAGINDFAEADCLSGERAIGGGGSNPAGDAVVGSYPTNGARQPVSDGQSFTGWVAGWHGGTTTSTGTAYVLCLRQ